MHSRWLRWRTAPFLVIGVGVAVAVAPYFRPSPVSDLGPIDLRPGAVRTATFKAGYSELYAIGLQMDQKAAKDIAPTSVNPDKFCSPQQPCKAWPASLSFSLSANGTDITKNIEANTATAGGEYGGQETFTWQAAFVNLQHGKEYHLTARSTADGSALLPAKPRIVVSVVTPGFYEGLMLQSFGAFVLAGVLIVSGAVWALVNWLRSRRRIATV